VIRFDSSKLPLKCIPSELVTLSFVAKLYRVNVVSKSLDAQVDAEIVVKSTKVIIKKTAPTGLLKCHGWPIVDPVTVSPQEIGIGTTTSNYHKEMTT
jgi:hypothetical protein